MLPDFITVELIYPDHYSYDDDPEYLDELENLISKAVNEFRDKYPEIYVTINGVS